MSALTYLAAAAGTADVQLRAAAQLVRGLSARETAAATASFVLRDGTSPSAPAVMHVTLTASESVMFELENEGIQFTSGVYLDRISGSTEVAVWV